MSRVHTRSGWMDSGDSLLSMSLLLSLSLALFLPVCDKLKAQTLNTHNIHFHCCHSQAHTHTHTKMHRQMYTHTHTHTQRCTDRCTHTDTHTHTPTHTHTHTSMHVLKAKRVTATPHCRPVSIDVYKDMFMLS